MASLPPPAPPPPRPAAPPPTRRIPRWGLPDAAVAFVVAVVGGAVGEIIAVVLSGAHTAANGDIRITAPILFGAVAGQYGTWFAALWFTSVRKGARSLRRDFGFTVDLVADWWMIPLGLGFEIVAAIVVLPISHLVKHTPQEVVHELDTAHGAKLVVLVATALVAAPVVEELFFRGLLLRALERRMSAPAAVTVAALAFGLAHVVFDFGAGVVLPALVALGMLSGYFAVRTGNLSRSILLHMGFNLLAVLAVLTNH